LLSYSQSTDPQSPHFGDQTRAYSAKRWHRLPFTAAEIAADDTGTPLVISE
jgi:acyl-homoserine-lactone acylase